MSDYENMAMKNMTEKSVVQRNALAHLGSVRVFSVCMCVCVRVHGSLADPLSYFLFVDSCFNPIVEIFVWSQFMFHHVSYIYIYIHKCINYHVVCPPCF